MSDFQHSCDDLTTDALPNPRYSQHNENVKSDNVFNNDSNTPQNKEQFHESRSNSFSTRKKTQSTPSASATIINISRSRDVHVGNKISYNFNGNQKNKKTDIPETPSVISLCESETPVTKEDLDFAASHMDSEWKEVARTLGIGDGQISQFILDNQIYGTKEVIYQILLDWYQNNPTGATIGKLCTILWNNNQKDIVKKWSERK